MSVNLNKFDIYNLNIFFSIISIEDKAQENVLDQFYEYIQKFIFWKFYQQVIF
jgi:hypothetical protein